MSSSGSGRHTTPCEGNVESVAGVLSRSSTSDRVPRGFVVQNEAAAPVLLGLLGQRGRVVPDDASLVAICSDQVALQSFPRLTSVSIPAREMGRGAVDLSWPSCVARPPRASTCSPPSSPCATPPQSRPPDRKVHRETQTDTPGARPPDRRGHRRDDRGRRRERRGGGAAQRPCRAQHRRGDAARLEPGQHATTPSAPTRPRGATRGSPRSCSGKVRQEGFRSIRIPVTWERPPGRARPTTRSTPHGWRRCARRSSTGRWPRAST